MILPSFQKNWGRAVKKHAQTKSILGSSYISCTTTTAKNGRFINVQEKKPAGTAPTNTRKYKTFSLLAAKEKHFHLHNHTTRVKNLNFEIDCPNEGTVLCSTPYL